MDILLLVLHVVLSLGIITLVLLQKGAGASAGASFGGGAGSVFGASGSANFLSKTTAIFATLFFLNSLALAYMAAHRDMQDDSVLDKISSPAVEVPAVETPAEDIPPPAVDDAATEAPGEAAKQVDSSTADEDVPPPAE
ncbi:MAG TPA: preprotein translocase subunit SecG [Gammaproteobacteria bacterium]|nr:preprotein translocase subunit SecG [Gammaproteobacteria bacterium]